MPSSKVIVGLAIGAVVVAGGIYAVTQMDPAPENAAAEASVASNDLRAGLISQLEGPTFDVIRAEFPEFYDEFVSDLEAQAEAGVDDAAIDHFATQRVASFRRDNAAYIRLVPDATAKSLIVDYLDTMRLILERRGPNDCARYANQGMLAFENDPIVDTLEPMLQRQAATVMGALAQGKARAEDGDAPSNPDWEAFRADLSSSEAGQAALTTLASGETLNVSICDALVTYMTALLAYDAPDAGALRADMAFGIISS